MPSAALAEYQANLIDVHRLVLAHRRDSGTSRGRRGLGHLTRGGLLLLCAAWERYVETVLQESATFLTGRLPSHLSLPSGVRQRVIDHTNDHRNAWTQARLNSHEWTTIYLEVVAKRTEHLNTPKYENLQIIFEQCIELPDIEAAWTTGRGTIDAFVSLRGEVAHRGRQSKYVRFSQLEKYESEISRYVIETDNFLSDYLRGLTTPARRPWNRLAP